MKTLTIVRCIMLAATLAIAQDSTELAATDYAKPYESTYMLSQPTAEVLKPMEINAGGSGVFYSNEKVFNGDFTFGLGGVAELSTSIKSIADNIYEANASMPVAALKIQAPGMDKLPIKTAVLINKSLSGKQEYHIRDAIGDSELVAYEINETEFFVLASYRYRRVLFNLGGKFLGTEIINATPKYNCPDQNKILFYPLAGLKFDANKPTQIILEVEGNQFYSYPNSYMSLTTNKKIADIKHQVIANLGVRYFIRTWISIDAGTTMNHVIGGSKDDFLSNAKLRTRATMMIPTQTLFRRIVNQFN